MDDLNNALQEFLAIKLKAHFGNPIGMWQGLMRDLFRHCDFTARDTCINLQWLVRGGVAADWAQVSYFRYDPHLGCRYAVTVHIERSSLRSHRVSDHWMDARQLIGDALAPPQEQFEELRMVPHDARYHVLDASNPNAFRADLPEGSQKYADAQFWHGSVAVSVTVVQLAQVP